MEDKVPITDLQGDNLWAQIAHKHWLNTTKKVTRVQPKVIQDEIWGPLEKEAFSQRAVQGIENLQILERYLWPGFNDNSSNQHVLLIALVLNAKKSEGLPTWELFDRPADFSNLFRRLLSISIETTLPPVLRTRLLVTIIGAFQSLDNGLVRKECAPLVSISVWHNLHGEAIRTRLLEKHPQFKKAWRAASKRFEGADQETQTRQRFERGWLYTLIFDFLDILYDEARHTADNKIYCERFLELLSDLQSQFPTRRYVNTLLQDLNLLVLIKQSPLYRDEDSGLLRDFHILLRLYTFFPIDDHTGAQLSSQDVSEIHISQLAQLQRIGLKYFPEKLRLLALANYGTLEKRDELSSHLEGLSDAEIGDLAVRLDYRTEYPTTVKFSAGRAFVTEVILSAHEKRPTFKDTIQSSALMPTDRSLYEPSFRRNETYNGTRPLAIPKINLQYLTTGDFLWRSFILFRAESFYEIRKDMVDTVKRLQPEWHYQARETRFKGRSRMAHEIQKPAIVEIVPPKVGESLPAEVRAEVMLDVSRMDFRLREEWESLKPYDVVFLLAVKATDDSKMLTNGSTPTESPDEAPFQSLRCAEVIQVQDDNGRPLRAQSAQANGFGKKPRTRRILVKLDAAAYQEDMDRKERGKGDVYDSINIIVRRRSRENNFKPMLESIRRLALTEVPLPSWLQDVFLGLGDPAGATYKNLPNAMQSLDFLDTFLDWSHLQESLPGVTVKAEDEDELSPPYVLKTSQQTSVPAEVAPKKSSNNTRKRKREEVDPATPTEMVEVSTYKPVNVGPYPTDAPRANTVRFTPAQVEAIRSGTQPGLTVVVGPPGTGKTDVATQMINNIYHNFPP